MKYNTKQLELLKSIGVHDSQISVSPDGKITISGNLYLNDLKELHPDALKGVVIGEWLSLNGLTELYPDALKGVTIGGGLYLNGLKELHPDALNGVTIGGYLSLNGLKELHPDALKGVVIGGGLSLNGLKELHPDALKGVVIGGGLYLNGLKELHPDALKGVVIGRGLSLDGLKELHPDALKGVVIGGWLSLNGLKELHPDALKGATIGGGLSLNGLNSKDRQHHKSVIQKLQDGYNEEKDYCYFDGILTKVLKVSNHIGYTIYTTPFGFVAQKDNKTAHGKTIKKAISDLEFKIIAEKLKHEAIYAETEITIQHYKAITGACDEGMKRWMAENKIEFSETDGVLQTTPIKAKDLLPLLENTSAYGLDRFKELVNF